MTITTSSVLTEPSSGAFLRPPHRLRGHPGCGRWLTEITRTARPRMATRRRATLLWRHSRRAGGGNEKTPSLQRANCTVDALHCPGRFRTVVLPLPFLSHYGHECPLRPVRCRASWRLASNYQVTVWGERRDVNGASDHAPPDCIRSSSILNDYKIPLR